MRLRLFKEKSVAELVRHSSKSGGGSYGRVMSKILSYLAAGTRKSLKQLAGPCFPG